MGYERIILRELGATPCSAKILVFWGVHNGVVGDHLLQRVELFSNLVYGHLGSDLG